MSIKNFIIFTSFCVVIIFTFSLNFGGDLQYFIYEDDSSWRNGLMSLIIRPLHIALGNMKLVALVWILLFVSMLSLCKDNISHSKLLYVLIFSPFLLFPSKESLSAFFAILYISSLRSRKLYNYLFVAPIIITRPFFLPALLFSLMLSSASRLKSLYVTGVIFCVALPFLPKLITSGPLYLDGYLSYAHGYFASAQHAGTTDWFFVYQSKYNPASLFTFFSYAIRSLFPFWMLRMGSNSAILYFFLYYGSLIVAFRWSRGALRERGFRFPSGAAALIVIIAVISASPLLISNAGSAVRYISVLPFIALIASSGPWINKGLAHPRRDLRAVSDRSGSLGGSHLF